jgi:hypothetical protein
MPYKNKEDQVAYDHQYHIDNKDKIRIRNQIRYAKSVGKDISQIRKGPDPIKSTRGYIRVREREREKLPKTREIRRKHSLSSKFSLTLDQFDEKLAEQGGHCAFPGCLREIESGSGDNLSVDHDRRCCPTEKACGKCNRGILCRTHNTFVGIVEKEGNLEWLLAWRDTRW